MHAKCHIALSCASQESRVSFIVFLLPRFLLGSLKIVKVLNVIQAVNFHFILCYIIRFQ